MGFFRNQIINQNTNISIRTLQDHLIPSKHLHRRINTGHQSLCRRFLVSRTAIKLTAAEQTTDFLEFQRWFQLRSRNTIIFYRISITDNLRMFKSRHRMIHLILNILRKRTGHTSHIHFICIKPLRLQKNLMSVFIGKLDNLILNRRTISWPCSLNNTRINR